MVHKTHNKHERKPKGKLDKLKVLEQKIKEKIKEAEENKELALRIKAEFDNYRKRTLREYDERINTANENLITRLLAVIDAFERGLKVEKIEGESFKSFYNGMELIYKQLMNILTEAGMEVIQPEKGEIFNPEIHEAVMAEEVKGKDEDIVMEVFEKGYRLSNRLLRASKVKVGRSKDKA